LQLEHHQYHDHALWQMDLNLPSNHYSWISFVVPASHVPIEALPGARHRCAHLSWYRDFVEESSCVKQVLGIPFYFSILPVRHCFFVEAELYEPSVPNLLMVKNPHGTTTPVMPEKYPQT